MDACSSELNAHRLPLAQLPSHRPPILHHIPGPCYVIEDAAKAPTIDRMPYCAALEVYVHIHCQDTRPARQPTGIGEQSGPGIFLLQTSHLGVEKGAGANTQAVGFQDGPNTTAAAAGARCLVSQLGSADEEKDRFWRRQLGPDWHLPSGTTLEVHFARRC